MAERHVLKLKAKDQAAVFDINGSERVDFSYWWWFIQITQSWHKVPVSEF